MPTLRQAQLSVITLLAVPPGLRALLLRAAVHFACRPGADSGAAIAGAAAAVGLTGELRLCIMPTVLYREQCIFVQETALRHNTIYNTRTKTASHLCANKFDSCTNSSKDSRVYQQACFVH